MKNYAIGKARRGEGYWIFDNDGRWQSKNFSASPPENRFATRRDAEQAIVRRGYNLVDWRDDT